MFTDPILNNLIKKYPTPTFTDRSAFLYEDLIESIVSQQLSVKASDTIFRRFKELFNTPEFPLPQQILSMPDEKIRTAGISFQKISYIKSVADAFANGLLDTKKIQKMPDEEVVTTLTQVRGVGKWTAEMILIFTLGRKDIFSLGDQGLKNAIHNLYGITDQKEILMLAEGWAPNRSTACWYLWKSLENS